MKKIVPFSFLKLRNMELANFSVNVINITEQNNPEVLKLTAVFNPLKIAEASIFLLSPKENSAATTVPYKGNRQERNNCVLGIKNMAKSILDINAEDKRVHIQILNPVIKANFTNYYRKNIVEQNEIVRQFLHQIDTTPALTEAVIALNMQSEIEHLRNIQSTFTNKYETTRRVRAEYVKKDSATIKSELNTLLEDFFVNLYLSKKQNKELDYTKLENELNAEIQRVKQILTERKPTKKKADNSTEQKSA